MMRYDTNDVLAASGPSHWPGVSSVILAASPSLTADMACHAARAVRRNKSVKSMIIEFLIIAAGC